MSLNQSNNILPTTSKENKMAKGSINIYGCGGTGINIAKHIASRSDEFSSDAFASREIYYLDTSTSNMGKISEDDPNVYIYKGADGAGKDRRHVAEVVMDNINSVLLKFKPADVNIFIASNSGGSGSVIAPTLISELLKRGESVILFGVNSFEDRMALKNVIASMKTYESISNLRERPVVACLFENNSETSELANNKRISDNVIMLSALFSRNNEGLDSQDLRNWLNFHKVTGFKPSFSQLIIQLGEVKRSSEHHLIAAAVLASSRENHKPYGFMVDYQTVGYFDQSKTNEKLNEETVNYLIYDGLIGTMFNRHQNMLDTLDEETRARSNKRGILNENDKPDQGGIHF